jgi:hypothetical protein
MAAASAAMKNGTKSVPFLTAKTVAICDSFFRQKPFQFGRVSDWVRKFAQAFPSISVYKTLRNQRASIFYPHDSQDESCILYWV